MSVSEPFIRRPVGTSLLAAGILLLGAVSYHFLPVAPLPKVDFPTINVSAQQPGVDPATAASSLAAPLERRFAQIAGVSLVRLGSVTHSFNNGQRFLWLAFQQIAGGLSVTAPLNGSLAPPGYYMLFILNTNGVPSVAAFVQIQ